MKLGEEYAVSVDSKVLTILGEKLYIIFMPQDLCFILAYLQVQGKFMFTSSKLLFFFS